MLLYNSRLCLFLDKLKSCRSGPFIINQVFPYGAVEITHKDKGTFKVNGQRLKLYLGGDQHISEKEDVDLYDLHS